MSSSAVLLVDRTLNPDDYSILISFKTMKEFKMNQNSYVLVTGNESKRIVCVVHKNDGKVENALLNRINRHNLGICLNDAVTIEPCKYISIGLEVTIGLMNCNDNTNLSKEIFKEMLRRHFKKGRKVLHENNKFLVNAGMRTLEFVVISTIPKPFCVVDSDITCVNFLDKMQRYRDGEIPLSNVSYDEIGGCNGLIQNIRKTVELPLRFPSVFMSLKAEIPRVIFYGPHGCGKALFAQAVATETRASFVLLNQKNTSGTLTETITKIKLVFQKALALAPSVLCIDSLDYFFPPKYTSDEFVLVANALLKLIQQLNTVQAVVILIGIATDIKNIHPTLCDLFKNTNTLDKRFKFRIPDISGRIQVLMIQTRNLNLANDFSITDLATITANFTPARLAYLCKRAAFKNKILSELESKHESEDTFLLLEQCLTNKDFEVCLNEI